MSASMTLLKSVCLISVSNLISSTMAETVRDHFSVNIFVSLRTLLIALDLGHLMVCKYDSRYYCIKVLVYHRMR